MVDDLQDVSMNTEPGRWLDKPVRQGQGKLFLRFAVRTHLIRAGERLDKTLWPYLKGRVSENDIVVLGEKVVAIAEGRAVLVASVKPRPMARFLSRHVRQLGYGLGLRRAETMEMAIREVGLSRIALAAVVGFADRLVGRSGDFYRVAGRSVAAIDGPGPTTIPPFHKYIVLAPERPEVVAMALARRLGVGVAVVDVNDVGSEVLYATGGVDRELVRELMRDNPMGQGAQSTPVMILRPWTQVFEESPWPATDIGFPGVAVMPNLGSGDDALAWANDQVASTEMPQSGKEGAEDRPL